jgi:Glycoside-hydrolase family GH114
VAFRRARDVLESGSMSRCSSTLSLLVLGLAACHGKHKDRVLDASAGDGGSGVNTVDGSVARSDASSTLPDGATTAVDGGGNGNGTTPGPDAGSVRDGGARSVTLPTENAPFDYQIGGDYTPPSGVRIVSRDRNGSPAPGLYNVCYVNGFQSQPGERSLWVTDHPELVLSDNSGRPLIDPEWPDEVILDVSTAEKRSAIFAIEREWLAGCAQKGFDAVEIDNLDTFTRFGNRLKEDDAVALIRMLADEAHALGLAIAQKNSAEIVGRKADMGTDFAVAEECNTYDECGDYTAAYGNHVLVIEYVRGDFQQGCRDFPQLSIVLRDRDVQRAGESGYVYEGC